MRGSLSIAGKINLKQLAQSHSFKMLLLCVSVGAVAGLFIGTVKMGLGLPGHKICFWMTPVLMARLYGKCKIGTAAGSLSAAFTTYALGGNLAGGILGMPLIAIGALIMDWTVESLQKYRFSSVTVILLIGAAGGAVNLICLTKRMLLPTGLSPHLLFGWSGPWFNVCSYVVFGFLSGVIAAVAVQFLPHSSLNKDQEEN